MGAAATVHFGHRPQLHSGQKAILEYIYRIIGLWNIYRCHIVEAISPTSSSDLKLRNSVIGQYYFSIDF